MTAPNERADVANLLADHLRRIRILEAQVASGCDCPGGHCLPSIWTSNCDTGEVTGTSTDPLDTQEILTLTETAVYPNNNNVNIRGLSIFLEMGGGPPIDCIPVGADVYIDSGGASSFRATGPIGYRADIWATGDALSKGAELQAHSFCGTSIGVHGIGKISELDCGGSAWGVVGYAEDDLDGGVLRAVNGSTLSVGNSTSNAAGVFCTGYFPAAPTDLDQVGVMASPLLDLVTQGAGTFEPITAPGTTEDYYGITTNAATRTARLYAFRNAGLLELRVNLNGTITVLATE